MDAVTPNLKLSIVCEGKSPGESWYGYSGRLDASMLQQMVPDLLERDVYLCGPEPYMRAVRAAFKELGFPPEQCHEESFGGMPPCMLAPATPEFRPGSEDIPSASELTVLTFARSGIRAPCTSEETLLDVAIRAGVWIPHACRMGICGTCKTRKLSGEVASDDLGALSDDERRQGYVLACCSRPQGEIVLDC